MWSGLLTAMAPLVIARGARASSDTSIEDAIENGTRLPKGIFETARTIVLDESGQELRGSGAPRSAANLGTIIRPTGNFPAILVRANGVKIDNIVVDGAKGRSRCGIVLEGGNRARISDCVVKGFNHSGLYLSASGNNNLAVVRDSSFIQNNYGIFVEEQRDNNALELYSVECSSNSSDGLKYSGQGMRVFGGIYSSNGAAGIRLSSQGDKGYTVGCIVSFPWLEGNAVAGVLSAGRSVRNRIDLDLTIAVKDNGHLNLPGSKDVVVMASTDFYPALHVKGRVLTDH